MQQVIMHNGEPAARICITYRNFGRPFSQGCTVLPKI